MVTSCSSTVRLLPCNSTISASKSAMPTRNTGQKERCISRPNRRNAPLRRGARLGELENSHSKNERRFFPRAPLPFFFADAFFFLPFFAFAAVLPERRLRRTGTSCSSPYWESSSSSREPMSGTSGRFSSSRMQTKLLWGEVYLL